MVTAAEKFDVVVALIEVIVEIAAAFWAFQQSRENAPFSADSRLFSAGATA